MNSVPVAAPASRSRQQRARQSKSRSALERDAAFRRRLDFEIRFLEGQRRARARGLPVRAETLGAYPACAELVRALAARLAARSAWPRSHRMVYRGRTVRVEVSSFGRVFVSTLDGTPIGASGYGSVWSD